MIDNLAIAVTHGLMLLAAWRLLSRADLDDDAAPREGRKGWLNPGRKAEGSDDA